MTPPGVDRQKALDPNLPVLEADIDRPLLQEASGY
jgi:hypothetical protein